MCGRYLLRAELRRLERQFGLEFSQIPRELLLRFNIAPIQDVAMVRNRPGRELSIVRSAEGGAGRELVAARWGLVPAWAREPSIGNRLINARAETLGEKPAFRAAFRARHCVVPASGFFEWRREGRGPKQPHLIRRKDGEPLGFAGLWEEWIDKESGEALTTCTIVTCPPNELMAGLHDRMPVVLDPKDYGAWLDPGRPGAQALLKPCPSEWLEAVPVSTRVNSPANDDSSVLEPVGGPVAAQGALL